MGKNNNNKHKRKPVPLTTRPILMQSRKKARLVTTLFHKHTRAREAALREHDMEKVRECDDAIEAMGGREEYQRASVCSTGHHSTSRNWVLSVLGKRGWLEGLTEATADKDADADADSSSSGTVNNSSGNKRRDVRLLEVGAINTDLIDAAKRRRRVVVRQKKNTAEDDTDQSSASTTMTMTSQPVYRLDVRAVDLRSMHDEIEEADFLTLPLSPCGPFDVVVCSMVLNCVTTAGERGRMLLALRRHLRPGGMCFLTLPRSCLAASKYMTEALFSTMLTDGAGFLLEETKNTPKVAYYVLRRPSSDDAAPTRAVGRWTTTKVLRRHKKYRNTFAVVFDAAEGGPAL